MTPSGSSTVNWESWPEEARVRYYNRLRQIRRERESLTRDAQKSLMSPLPTPPFHQWLTEVTPTFNWNWKHLAHIRQSLERVTTGELRRLMIQCPPRHGKSEMTTIRYPVWRMVRNPEMRVIVGCYNQTLANKFARKAKRLAEGRLIFRPDRKAVDDWETLQDGGMRAVGVGAGITGQGGDLVIIDDPVKSREEANSEAYREKVWDWYTDDLYTRLQPRGAVILIMTRWHEDDLAGRILASEDGPTWSVVNLPVMAEADDPLGRAPGELLCPEWFGEADVADRRRVLGSWAFAALYQQRPAPMEGAIFKRSDFRYYERRDDLLAFESRPAAALAECWRFATVDLATTEDSQADYTVITAWAVTPQSDLVLLDLHRERMESPKILPAIKRINDRWDLDFIAIEKVGFQASLIQQARIDGLSVKPLKPREDKVSRAYSAAPRFEAGMVHFPKSAPWLDDLEGEMLSFPNATHDDQVDVVAYACIEVGRAYGTAKPAEVVAEDTDVDATDDSALDAGQTLDAADPFLEDDEWD